MIADLQSGQISAVDQVPFTAVNAVKKTGEAAIDTYPGGEITNITWNSNPYKPQHRELLDPKVKEALSMCVDRQQIIQVVFSGYAAPTESLLGDIAKPWQSTDYQPLKFDCDAANQTLDQLGYKKGSDGSGSRPQPPARVLATDPKTRRAFAAYWLVIRPGSSAIRREVLKVVARRAESSLKAR